MQTRTLMALAALAVTACAPRDQAGRDEAARDSGMPAAMPDTNAPAPAAQAAAPEPGAMLESTEWSLLELNGKIAIGADNRPLTLLLDPAARRAAGFAGCNRYSGSYELSGNSLKFGPMIMTKMACNEAMDTESAYAEALGKVTGWRITGGNLELLAGETVVAKYRAAA
ncbi:MAG: META domain-containing protein [Gemmatimonadales bacterium]